MFYSKSMGGFVTEETHGGAMPADKVKITPEYHKELLDGQTANKIIVADSKGYPRLEDRPALTPQQAQEQRSQEARAYLNSTDWYVVRKAETGADIPADVTAKRQVARDSIVG